MNNAGAPDAGGGKVTQNFVNCTEWFSTLLPGPEFFKHQQLYCLPNELNQNPGGVSPRHWWVFFKLRGRFQSTRSQNVRHDLVTK